MKQVLNLVVLGVADRLVEAASAAGRGDYVPEADAPLRQPHQSLLILHRL